MDSQQINCPLSELMTNEEIREWAFSLDPQPEKKSKLNSSMPQISSSATINRACQKQQEQKVKQVPRIIQTQPIQVENQKQKKEIIHRLKLQNRLMKEMIQQQKDLLEQMKKS
ncbi:unnamed protein product (macronuclear) [Paramecium tetraurelia]|uniref:Uncharacterized protein n=1 Tax=Paramecium tetraurelia TaxID=5888 RepID=A0DTR1_PARTE|nr:uncharacterized protein GSPATT00020110001 [Paramecium tetraurelia]CAK86428.1 unnamed protein product [Paramecium tetraurelia]|eukprot:XP_001453825.1 hypothetical protein (macronuclear) [Paramecium tetraurelia strain d4-2]